MCCIPKLTPTLLLHINLLIALYAGAMLATGARLKWDPTTYVVVRELAAAEYYAVAVLMPALGLALLLNAHLAVLAVTCRSTTLYATYALCSLVLLCLELGVSGWAALHVQAWLASEHAADLQDALELRHHLQPILDALGKWHPLPTRLNELIQEAELDAPRNGYCAGAAAAVLLVLQMLGLVLATSAAVRHHPKRHSHPYHEYDGASRSSSEDKEPLRAAYRKGRLVML